MHIELTVARTRFTAGTFSPLFCPCATSAQRFICAFLAPTPAQRASSPPAIARLYSYVSLTGHRLTIHRVLAAPTTTHGRQRARRHSVVLPFVFCVRRSATWSDLALPSFLLSSLQLQTTLRPCGAGQGRKPFFSSDSTTHSYPISKFQFPSPPLLCFLSSHSSHVLVILSPWI